MSELKPPEVTEAQLFEQIGRLSTKYSSLEDRVGVLLSVMLRASLPVMSTLIDGLFFSARIRTVRRLAMAQFAENPERVDRYRDLCKRLDAIRERRNLFVHGTWKVDPPHCIVSKSDGPGHLPHLGVIKKEKDTTLSLSNLMTQIEDVHTLQDRISALIGELVREYVAEVDAKNPP